VIFLEHAIEISVSQTAMNKYFEVVSGKEIHWYQQTACVTSHRHGEVISRISPLGFAGDMETINKSLPLRRLKPSRVGSSGKPDVFENPGFPFPRE
jgi:hypothetical protein